MGSGSFSLDSYRAYASCTTLRSDGTSKSVHEVFSKRSLVDALDPSTFAFRESRDSADNPESTPLIFALDVTGSMGMIAHQIVKSGLGDIMNMILSSNLVTNPHVMFMGIGDVRCDSAPLQVSQFEADIRIAQQLTDLYLEGGGGGNQFESYDLAWYFASERCKCDSFAKRGKKGFLFTFGDELPPEGLNAYELGKVFGGSYQAGYTVTELYEMARKEWEVFHLVIEEGSFARRTGVDPVLSMWENIMSNRAIPVKDYRFLPDVIAAVIRVANGEDVHSVVASYQGDSSSVVKRALRV